MYVCYICVYVYVYSILFVCICAYIYIYVYACMFVYMYVFIDRCMYVCIFVLILCVCVSISTMRVCLTYLGLGFDVCSSIQEELQRREMAFPSSIVEGGQSTPLIKRQKHDDVRVYYIVRSTNQANSKYHTGS